MDDIGAPRLTIPLRRFRNKLQGRDMAMYKIVESYLITIVTYGVVLVSIGALFWCIYRHDGRIELIVAVEPFRNLVWHLVERLGRSLNEPPGCRLTFLCPETVCAAVDVMVLREACWKGSPFGIGNPSALGSRSVPM